MGISAGSIWGLGPVVNQTTAAFTVTAADSGTIYRLNVANPVCTLPATQEGLVYAFVVDTVSGSGTGASISPAAADNINGHTTDGKDLINTQATEVKGDSVIIVGDGDEGWVTIAMHGIWAMEA